MYPSGFWCFPLARVEACLLLVAALLVTCTHAQYAVGIRNCPLAFVVTNTAVSATDATTTFDLLVEVTVPVLAPTVTLVIEERYSKKFAPNSLAVKALRSVPIVPPTPFPPTPQPTATTAAPAVTPSPLPPPTTRVTTVTVVLSLVGLWVVNVSLVDASEALLSKASCGLVMGRLPALSVTPAGGAVEPLFPIGLEHRGAAGNVDLDLPCWFVTRDSGVAAINFSGRSTGGRFTVALPRTGVYAMSFGYECTLPSELFKWQRERPDLFTPAMIAATASGPTALTAPDAAHTFTIPSPALPPVFKPPGGGSRYPIHDHSTHTITIGPPQVERDGNGDASVAADDVQTFFIVVPGATDTPAAVPSYSSPAWRVTQKVSPSVVLDADCTVFAFSSAPGKLKSDIARSLYVFAKGASTWMYVIPSVVMGVTFGVYVVYLLVTTFVPKKRSKTVDFFLTGLVAVMEVVNFGSDIAFVAVHLAVAHVATGFQVAYSIMIIFVAIFSAQRILWSGRFRDEAKQWHFIPGVNILQLFRTSHVDLMRYERDRMWWSGLLGLVQSFPGLLMVALYSSEYPTRTGGLSVAKLFLCIGTLVFGFQSVLTCIVTFPMYARRYCGGLVNCEFDAVEEDPEEERRTGSATAVTVADRLAPPTSNDPTAVAGDGAGTATAASEMADAHDPFSASPERELVDDVLVAREVHLLRQLKAIRGQLVGASEPVLAELRVVQEVSRGLSPQRRVTEAAPSVTASSTTKPQSGAVRGGNTGSAARERPSTPMHHPSAQRTGERRSESHSRSSPAGRHHGRSRSRGGGRHRRRSDSEEGDHQKHSSAINRSRKLHDTSHEPLGNEGHEEENGRVFAVNPDQQQGDDRHEEVEKPHRNPHPEEEQQQDHRRHSQQRDRDASGSGVGGGSRRATPTRSSSPRLVDSASARRGTPTSVVAGPTPQFLLVATTPTSATATANSTGFAPSRGDTKIVAGVPVPAVLYERLFAPLSDSEGVAGGVGSSGASPTGTTLGAEASGVRVVQGTSTHREANTISRLEAGTSAVSTDPFAAASVVSGVGGSATTSPRIAAAAGAAAAASNARPMQQQHDQRQVSPFTTNMVQHPVSPIAATIVPPPFGIAAATPGGTPRGASTATFPMLQQGPPADREPVPAVAVRGSSMGSSVSSAVSATRRSGAGGDASTAAAAVHTTTALLTHRSNSDMDDAL